MIQLEVEEYCHECPKFTPVLGEIIRTWNLAVVNTPVTCKYEEECKAIASYLGKKFDNLDEEYPTIEVKGELRNLRYIELEEGNDFMISVRDSSIKLYSYRDNELLIDSLGNAVKFVAKKKETE